MKAGFTLFLSFLFFFFSTIQITIAQDNLYDKIDEITGKVDKITITAHGKEYTFEGTDAEKLFKQMKQDHTKSFVWNSSDDSGKKVIILKTDDDEDEIEVESIDDVYIVKSGKDLSDVDEGMTKKVKVEVEDGNKKVTVTTNENGEETTEVYEGKEADEFIEKMKSEHGDMNIQIDSEKDGKKVKKIIIETESETD